MTSTAKKRRGVSKRLHGAVNQFGGGRVITLVFLSAFVIFRIWDPVLLETMRLRIFDFYQFFQPRERTQLPVVIVDIDESSLERLGQWPWPRTRVADMVRNITQAGGVAIAFDMIFSEPDRMSPERYADSMPGLDPSLVEQLETLPSTDAQLAAAMQRSRVVLGQAARAGAPDPERARPKPTPVALLGGDPKPYLLTYPSLLRNLPILEDSAAGKGLFSISPDLDSIVRRVGLVSVVDGAIQPGLSVELLRVATGGNAIGVKTDEAGVKSLVVGGVEVPTDRNGRMWVHYSPHDPARFISAADVVEGTVNPIRLRNHLVLVGTSAIGLLDLKATPLDPAMPGVEVHAQILETMLGQSFLNRPHYALGAELLIAIFLSVVVIYLAPILGAIPVMLMGAGLTAAVLGGSWFLYTEHRILLDVVYPLLTSFSVFLILVFLNYRREEVQRQQIRLAFGQYLAPAYVEQIASNPEQLALGGATRTMSILFSDVRGFTSISESFKNDPQGLTELMNRFLTPLSDAIMKRKGTIDKYMGDAVMAFWNAPLDDEAHAQNACAAALDMFERLEAVNLERMKEAEEAGRRFVPLDVGIGINTGECVVGNMGSEFRFDYSVLGDAVNLASRLEGQSKTYGVRIILGSETAARAAGAFAVMEIDLIRVKGKNEPERIFCLAGDDGMRTSTAFQSAREVFAEMLRAYRSQDWTGAERALHRFKDGAPKELIGLVPLYQARIEAFREAPPPEDWDGVFVAQTK